MTGGGQEFYIPQTNKLLKDFDRRVQQVKGPIVEQVDVMAWFITGCHYDFMFKPGSPTRIKFTLLVLE